MRCDGCSRRAPTRFVIFGKAVGMVLVSTWEQRPADLCASCLKKRFREWTGLTAVLGWWGTQAFGHALRYIPGNVLEYRRAMRTEPLPDDPSDVQIAEATALRARLLLMLGAADRIFYGGAGALLGVVFLLMLPMWKGSGWSGDRTIILVIGVVALAIGGAVVASGVRRRRSIAAMPAEELAALGEGGAPSQ